MPSAAADATTTSRFLRFWIMMILVDWLDLRDRSGSAGAALLLIDPMKVAKNEGAFLLSHRGQRSQLFSGRRTVLRSEPSRRECVALARLARQPVPHAVSLARSSRKQRGQSCISHDARRAPWRCGQYDTWSTRTHKVSGFAKSNEVSGSRNPIKCPVCG